MMRILLVDDEQELLDNLLLSLNPTGHSFQIETNPLEALKAYKNEHFDVVITDIRMPEMNGIDLLREIRAYDPKAYVIIITGYGDIDTAIKAINNRAFAFFGKPIDFKELIDTLRQIEREIQQGFDVHVDVDKLRNEYGKLKKSYTDLLELVNEADAKRAYERV